MLNVNAELEGSSLEVLAACLSLSMATQTPFRMDNVLSKATPSGLCRPALALIRAAAMICNAELEGNEIGSRRLIFRPKTVLAGSYEFQLPLAQGLSQVLLCLLPALMKLEESSSLALQGATHDPGSPSTDFLSRVFIPVLEQVGPSLRVKVERPGFFPAGGGKVTAEIKPSASTSSWEIFDGGRLLKNSATILLAHESKKLAQRQLEQVQSKLSWKASDCRIEVAKHAIGPGSVLCLEMIKENVSALFCGYAGAHDTPHQAGQDVIERFRRFAAQRVPVSPMLAQTLLVPLALSQGGEFRTTPLSKGSTDCIRIIQRFLEVRIDVEHSSRADAIVRIQT